MSNGYTKMCITGASLEIETSPGNKLLLLDNTKLGEKTPTFRIFITEDGGTRSITLTKEAAARLLGWCSTKEVEYGR